METGLTDKVVLVTGGSRGIGRAIALAFAAEGASVAISYHIRREAAEAVVGEIRRREGRAAAFQADLASPANTHALFDAVDETFGGLDVLVVNAGQVGRGQVHELTEAEWQHILNVNLSAAFRCVQLAVARLLARGGGTIITVSSDAAKRGGRATGVHYAASKGGLLAMSYTLARQLARHRIRVNDVAPAEIQTDMLADRASENLDLVRQRIPLGRLGAPEDVARAVVFLASEAAAFITGVSLDVDGGLHLE